MSEKTTRREFLEKMGKGAAVLVLGGLAGAVILEITGRRGQREYNELQRKKELENQEEAEKIKRIIESSFNQQFVENIYFEVNREDQLIRVKLIEALRAGLPPPGTKDQDSIVIPIFVEASDELYEAYGLKDQGFIEASFAFVFSPNSNDFTALFQPYPRGEVDLESLFELKESVLKKPGIEVVWEKLDTQYAGTGTLEDGKIYRATINSVGGFQISVGA